MVTHECGVVEHGLRLTCPHEVGITQSPFGTEFDTPLIEDIFECDSVDGRHVRTRTHFIKRSIAGLAVSHFGFCIHEQHFGISHKADIVITSPFGVASGHLVVREHRLAIKNAGTGDGEVIARLVSRL